jgi:hypothetical protein
VLAARVFALLLLAHATGLVHDVADVVAVIATGADAPHDDEAPGDCRDARGPLGCPNCHSSHPAGSLPQGVVPAEFFLLSECSNVVGFTSEAQPRSLTDPRSIYRPPRRSLRAS